MNSFTSVTELYFIAMKLPEEEAFNSIITAIQAKRTDVLKAVLDTIIKSKHLFGTIYVCVYLVLVL